ncbi:hypothetical protein I601_1734 [Nocardioides dokdonensis FR1436]|uniref:Uncharacterized protein n=1 Tax=Nocardioides dokdonensis FR1436 TaxID=1300347 RepID=A0A1A9GL49_9ACTN|nr:hypothetical protein [Nocardioides dokdonensis]ANH38165.1 hypothetical protein I601_1734 [Nocardioides dokdonensis FR1436]
MSSAHATGPMAHQFVQRARELTEGTPYTVSATEKGFDVTLDIVDAQWFGLFNKAGLKRVFTHHVVFHGPDLYSITDESRRVSWTAGVPSTVGGEVSYGRIIQFGAQKVWAFDEHGSFGVQADYRFHSEEGRDLITGVAQELGLRSRRGAAERIALVMAIIGGGGAIVTGIVLVVLLLLGAF